MRYCAFCANEVSDELDSCPFCGKRMPKQGSATRGGPRDPAAAQGSDQAPPMTYPLPAAGEGATMRGFAPVLPPPPKTAQQPAAAPLVPTDEPTLPAAPAPVIPPPAIDDDLLETSPGEPRAVDREQAAIDSGVAPMPDAPVGLLGCLPYVFAVFSARRLRRQVVRGLHAQIEGEKQQIHEALRDLGQAARRTAAQSTVAQDEIARLVQLETARGEAEVAKGALDAQLAAEEERFAQIERGQHSTAEAHRAELTAAQGDLAQVDAEMSRHQQQLAELARQRAALERERQNAEDQAQKAPDASEKEVLIRSAAEKDVALDEVANRARQVEAQLAVASAPRAALEQRVLAARGGLEQAQAAINTARSALESQRRAIDEERRRGGMKVTQLEREIMHAQVVVGRVLDSFRPPSEDSSFEEHYGRIDGHRRVSDEIMRQIGALEAEREAFDRQARKRGLMLLGSMVGLVVLTVLVLVLAL